MSMKSILSPLLLGVVALGGFLVYVSLPEEEKTSASNGFATPVRAESVVLQTFPVTIEALGTANANESVTITAQQTDRVREVKFDDGDHVKVNQLLVQLSNEEELARVVELEANIDEAQRQFERVVNLAKTRAASQQILDEQQARVKALTAQLDVAKAQLSELEIRAPFSGVLGIRNVSVGSLVQPGEIITTLDDISVIKVDFSVAEGQLASLSPGQRVFARSVAYPGETFEGEISTIDSRIDPVSRSVLVRGLIKNNPTRLRPGMLLQITLEKQVLETLVIPEKALVPIQDKQFVFVIDGDVVHQREVIIGERKPGIVQIVDGLSEGERIVTEGTLRVQQNSKVRVLDPLNAEGE
ncbi:efflux RND transporter periplasmic adaptor subunit [Alteromonas confluentis]|uniref:Efflux transporter periplasmic adaptor subunit n=1 Tax=Alteromonas confluentis TaxID=1656094 RepID=A0A1E7ZEW0_9ALTE|nr:efflux RND transporter periplasmic adaptor subunit [Alteromonas confluentis]OFC72036.1 efflux transporter periplasmic adaptor subunit [Alteromonas confluentis]